MLIVDERIERFALVWAARCQFTASDAFISISIFISSSVLRHPCVDRLTPLFTTFHLLRLSTIELLILCFLLFRTMLIVSYWVFIVHAISIWTSTHSFDPCSIRVASELLNIGVREVIRFASGVLRFSGTEWLGSVFPFSCLWHPSWLDHSRVFLVRPLRAMRPSSHHSPTIVLFVFVTCACVTWDVLS
jgi:hypothetical protein